MQIHRTWCAVLQLSGTLEMHGAWAAMSISGSEVCRCQPCSVEVTQLRPFACWDKKCLSSAVALKCNRYRCTASNRSWAQFQRRCGRNFPCAAILGFQGVRGHS